MATVDVLIPSYSRPCGLGLALASLLGQTFRDFRVIVSDQSPDEATLGATEVRTAVGALRWHGHEVMLHRHLPRRGLAEQRQFLLEQSDARYVHFIDDDVVLAPEVLGRMLDVIRSEGCGFVGCAAVGLDFIDDERPHEQHIEIWEGPVRPETFPLDRIPWERHRVNNAANPLHLERRLCPDGRVVRYKVAWIGGANVLYDRGKLLAVGGFSWWRRLPEQHAGEEVLAQLLLLRRFGGCGVLPSGTYHLGLPTTVPERTHNAVALLDEIEREREHEAHEDQEVHG
jgi:glycosyltransferase involved in cell wall biosynthesis